jgi:hypothetical protein
LSGRQIVDLKLGGEIALWQRVDESAAHYVFEAIRSRDFELHPRGAIGSGPHDARVDIDIAGLQTMGDKWAFGCEAEIWSSNSPEYGNSCCHQKLATRR